MKSIIRILLVMTILISTLQGKTITIVTPNNFVPYSFIDENNELRGFLIDYWTLFGKKTNSKIKFIALNLPDSIKALKKNEVDLHSGLHYFEKREEQMQFIFPFYNTSTKIFVRKKYEYKITRIEDLNGKKVGVYFSSIYSRYLKNNFPLLEIKEFTSLKSMVSALDLNKVDAIFSEYSVAKHEMQRIIKSPKFRVINDINFDKYLFAVSNKKSKSFEVFVQKGLKSIKKSERNELERKWFNEESIKYDVNKNDILSIDEILYLEKNKNLYMAFTNEWQLKSFYNENGVLDGLHVDLLKLINKKLNINIKQKVYTSWTKAYEDVKNGKINGIFGLSYIKQRLDYFTYSRAYFFNPHYLIIRKSDKSINTYKDTKNKILVTQKNSIFDTTRKNKYPQAKTIYSNNNISTFNKLLKKEADFSLYEDAHEYDLSKYGLIIKLTIINNSSSLHIGTYKKDKIFSSIIDKAFDLITEKELKDLKKKWKNKDIEKNIFTKEELIYIKNSPILKIGVDDWAPILYSKDGMNMLGVSGIITKKIMDISGFKYNLVQDTWNNLLVKFKNKEVDILPDTSFTKKREKFGEFTQSYLNNSLKIYVKKSKKNIFSFNDLNNKTLAIVKGYFFIPFIKSKYPEINLVLTSTLNESISRLLDNEVDAIISYEINTQYKLKNLLITNIKSINQHEITNSKISFFSKKDDLLLNSILKKSLYQISSFDKNKIISNFLNKKDTKKQLNVLFSKGREPYSYFNDNLKGIEYELIEKILEKSEAIISKLDFSSFSNILNKFSNNKDNDLAVTVKSKNNDYFYSKDFMSFENSVITRIKDNIFVNNLNDIKNKKVLAFPNARTYLGEEYKNIFNKKNIYYKESISEKKQVKDFLDKKSDVLIIDKNIFKWYLKEFSLDPLSLYKFDFIFKDKNSFNVVFRDKEQRDIFDLNLIKIKESGEYKQIMDRYLNKDIISKIKVNTLLSELFSKFIYLNDIKEIKKIADVFLSLSYVLKIDIIDEYGNLFFTSGKGEYRNSTKIDTYYNVFNNRKKIAEVKIYFDEKTLKEKAVNNELIVDISSFETFDSYSYIKDIYEKFNYLNKDIKFSKIELEYIKNNPILRFSEVNWQPLSIVENNIFNGLYSDYIKIIENKTTLKFKFVKSSSFIDVLNKFKNKEIDIVPINIKKNDNNSTALFSNKFTSFKYALVMRENESFYNKLVDLKGKIITAPKYYSSLNIIKKKAPYLKVIEAKSNKEALTLVAQGKADVTLIHEAIAIYNIKKSFPNLKIVGLTNNVYIHKFSVQKDNHVLLSILNKVIDSISYKQKEVIRDKWIFTEIKTATDYTLVYNLLIIFFIILLIVLFFLSKLKLANNKIKEEKKKFETLFLDTQDAVILYKNGKYIDVNNAILDLFKYKNKEDFLNMKPGTISPLYQKNKKKSLDIMSAYLKQCYKDGTVRFEWIAKKSSGEEFWAEFVITKLNYNNEDVLHMLCRDITKNKNIQVELEEQKENFETLFKDASDAIVLVKDGKYIEVNNACLNLFGYKTKENFTKVEIGDLAPELQEDGQESRIKMKKLLNECLIKGNIRFEWISLTENGKEFYLEVVGTKLVHNKDDIIQIVCRDISSRKNLENEVKQRSFDLEKSNKDLENSIKTLKQAQEQLVESEKMASLGGLVAGVAHEINTPVGISLTGITHLEDLTYDLYRKYIKEKMTQAEFEEYIDTSKELTKLIHTNLKKAASLVRSFKQVAVDQSSEEKRVFDLCLYVNEVLTSLNSVIKKTNIKISIDCNEEIKINSYAGAYSQVLTNLIMNSIVHAFEKDKKGEININISKNKDEIIILYKDNGIGIKEENLSKIFDPFYTTKRDKGGSGLGLNIIYNIITSKLNGSIICKSKVDKGVEFNIILKI